MGEKKAEVPVGKELVRMTGIMKEFPGVKALDNVNWTCMPERCWHCWGKTVQVSQH